MFTSYPKVSYNVDGIETEIVNVATALVIQRILDEKAFAYQEITISNAETPESLAAKLYHDKKYAWIIRAVNFHLNPYYEWYKTFNLIESICKAKYPDGLEGIHSFYDLTLDRVCDDYDTEEYRKVPVRTLPQHIIPVTNYEFEIKENEKHRIVRVLHPGSFNRFIVELQQKLRDINNAIY